MCQTVESTKECKGVQSWHTLLLSGRNINYLGVTERRRKYYSYMLKLDLFVGFCCKYAYRYKYATNTKRLS